MDSKIVDSVFKVIGFTEPDRKLTPSDVEIADIGFDAFVGVELMDAFNVVKVITETGSDQSFHEDNAGDIRDHSLFITDTTDPNNEDNEWWYFRVPGNKIAEMSKLSVASELNRNLHAEDVVWQCLHGDVSE